MVLNLWVQQLVMHLCKLLVWSMIIRQTALGTNRLKPQVNTHNPTDKKKNNPNANSVIAIMLKSISSD